MIFYLFGLLQDSNDVKDITLLLLSLFKNQYNEKSDKKELIAKKELLYILKHLLSQKRIIFKNI